MVHRQKTTEIALLSVGVGFTVLGVLMSQHWESIIQTNFNREMALRPESKSFQNWRLTPVPIIMRVYFWNWTNPELLSATNYTPSFAEMGPYVFREEHEKVGMTWNENGTVTYRLVKRWWFVEEESNGSLSDNITSINVVAATAAHRTRHRSPWTLYLLSFGLVTTGQEVMWTRNVSQLLFEGFENPLQKIGSYVEDNVPDKFGWFYNMNGTASANVFNMDTGTEDVEHIGVLRYLNYRNTTDAYNGSCSDVTGFVGELWPPNRTKTEPLDMFTTDMCRKVSYYYERESSHNDIRTYVYAGTERTVDNGSQVEENECYSGPEECPSGVFDMSSCHQDAPVFLSYPHFYRADSSYRDAVQGMNPDPEKHKFYIALEPRTGVQMDVAARLQINVLLQKSPIISLYRNVPTVHIPVYWIETRVSLSEKFTSDLKVMLQLISLGPIIWYGICILGVLIILGVAVFHLCSHSPLTRLRTLVATQNKEKMAVHVEEEDRLHPSESHMKNSVKYVISTSESVIIT